MEQHTPPPRSGVRPATATKQRPAPRRIRSLILFATAAVLAVALAVGFYSWVEAGSRATGPTAGAPSASATPEATVEPPSPIDAALDSQINAIIDANSQYQIGVALVDLTGDAGSADIHEYGVGDPFVAASTAKVLAAAAYYHLVETGAASLDDPLGNYTAGFQIQEMIQQSDNDSWSLIMDAVGHPELSEYAASLGIDYTPESNTLAPADMARILAALYSGSLLDSQDTAQLLSYMQDTNYETLIPAAVPDGITVFHKYGLLDDELHDVGILAQGDAAYALVIYTKGEDLSDVPERTEVIHELTEAVTGTLFQVTAPGSPHTT